MQLGPDHKVRILVNNLLLQGRQVDDNDRGVLIENQTQVKMKFNEGTFRGLDQRGIQGGELLPCIDTK